MNNIIIKDKRKGSLLISVLSLCVYSGSVNAQDTDSTFVREMLIEKEYTPVVKDADKIVRMPAVEAPQANKTRIVYSDPKFKYVPDSGLENLSAGDVGTEYEFNKEIGYSNIGYGNYNNILFDNGVKFIDTEDNKFGLKFNVNSVNGKLKSNQTGEKSKMRNANTDLKLFYNHKAENMLISSDIKLGWNTFSYYGGAPGYWDEYNQFMDTEREYPVLGESKYFGQRLSRFGANVRVDSRNNEEWEYKGFLSFNRLGFKRPDFNENGFHLGGQLSKFITDDWKLTGDVDLKYLFYGGDRSELKNSGLSSFKAYFDYINNDISFKGGLVLDIANGLSPHFSIAPYLDLVWKSSDILSVFASVKGGMKQYSFDEETRNVCYFLGDQTRNSYTPFDLNLGLRISPVTGLQFDITGEMDYTCNQRFYKSVLQNFYIINDMTSLDEYVNYNMNYVGAYTSDAFRCSLKGSVKYNYGKVFDAGFSIKGNAYSIKKDLPASYMPKFELDANLSYRPIDKLILNVDLGIKTRHDALVEYVIPDMNVIDPSIFEFVNYLSAKEVSLKTLNSLDFKATYIFNKNIAAFGKLDNIFNNKNDIWYGMPSMGINLMVGVNVKY